MFKDIESLSKGLYKNLPSTMTFTDDNYLMSVMMDLNLNRFGFNKSIAKVVDLNKALQEVSNFNDFKQKAKLVLGNYNVNYLRTEYNLAVAAAQNGARWNQQKAERDIFPYLEYQTAGDDKVRDAHKALDGKLFNINDEDWRSIYPPNGYGCRCEMLQVDADEAAERTDDILTGPEANSLLGDEYGKMIKAGFNANRGEIGEIYKLNKIYSKQLKNIEESFINRLSYKSIGLSSIANISSNKKLKLKPTTPNQVIESFGDNKNKIYYDYLGRMIGLSARTVSKHSTEKYLSAPENRFDIFNNIVDVLKSPDEVWMLEHTEGNFQYTYLKYYKEETIVVPVSINKLQGFQIKTWFKLTDESSIRQGILIKKAY